ncbi:uncharacterized protein N7446_009089 [Penicillium canescens]|uniref:Uncharacterized protein n=1 Tax=Penicillium canescens TaxID=5083 RepID=A0AAD6I5L2_PENCN|nr:uncharacterized protein N7446_009089 [Penicillium canescens]KAJ6034340.1 hypothetical protein N7460_008515 [Penicillium canescens]KAJ6046002.1 hypothetical protein N7444_007256 [Penicillium canescens]KAJ6053077.1 hypothetical protein N7446_009089 [Penicillium canescens]
MVPESTLDTSWVERRHPLIALPDSPTQQEYRTLTSLIKENTPEFADWATHKEITVIAAGLCQAFSLIKPEFFKATRNHTNAVEQTHYKSYWMGTRDSLLQAVQSSRILDQTDIDQYHGRENFDILPR